MKRRIIFFIVFVLFIVSLLFFFRNHIAQGIVSAYLSGQLDADVHIERSHIGPYHTLAIESLSIRNKDEMYLNADSGVLRFYPFELLRKGLRLKFQLSDVFFSYPNSKIIDNVFNSLSLTAVDGLEFASAEGEFSYNKGIFMLKSLNLDGNMLKLNAYGMSGYSLIDYNIGLSISDLLTSEIPEQVRKVFFKADGDWSEVELQISGSKDNPSINFKTDLFTLSVN
jgi:hypothetical protein